MSTAAAVRQPRAVESEFHPPFSAAAFGSTMRDVEHVRRATGLSDVLLSLEQEYVDTIALLDGSAACQRIVAEVPELVGVDMAFLGEPHDADQIVLNHPVNTVTDQVAGLVIPQGTGLGGRVLATGRPLWVSNYLTSPDITDHFKPQVAAERVMAMIAVPVGHNGKLRGVLYGANRYEIDFGDRTALALERLATRMAAAEVVAERARHAAEVAVYEERRRLALELHDSVGAMLFTLRSGIQRLGDEPDLHTDVRARIGALEAQASDAADALRGSLRVLNTPPEQVALGVALREHVRAFADRTGVIARTIVLTELPAIPRAPMRALADATREALLNVEKHACARSVVVSVFSLRDGVAVTVSDDGVGLRHAFEHSGMGLESICEQLARVGGTVAVGTNDDGGVTTQAWVPV